MFPKLKAIDSVDRFQRNRLCKNEKYLTLDPNTSDLTIVRIIKVRTGYRCIDIRRIVVSK